MRDMGLAPTADPWPGTPAGARALVERFYALKRAGKHTSTQVAVGGAGGGIGATSPNPFPTKKTKRVHNWVYDFDGPWRKG